MCIIFLDWLLGSFDPAGICSRVVGIARVNPFGWFCLGFQRLAGQFVKFGVEGFGAYWG